MQLTDKKNELLAQLQQETSRLQEEQKAVNLTTMNIHRIQGAIAVVDELLNEGLITPDVYDPGHLGEFSEETGEP